jgi:hypothetical protein
MLGWEILGTCFGFYICFVIIREGVIRYGKVFARKVH